MNLKEFKKCMKAVKEEIDSLDTNTEGACFAFRLNFYAPDVISEDFAKYFYPDDLPKNSRLNSYWWGEEYKTQLNIDGVYRAEGGEYKGQSPRMIAIELFELIAIEEKLYKEYE